MFYFQACSHTWNLVSSEVPHHKSLHMITTHLCYCINTEMAVMLPEIAQLDWHTGEARNNKKFSVLYTTNKKKPPSPKCFIKYNIVHSCGVQKKIIFFLKNYLGQIYNRKPSHEEIRSTCQFSLGEKSLVVKRCSHQLKAVPNKKGSNYS